MIMRSILDTLLPLGDEVHVYPATGPSRPSATKCLYNPFIVEVLNQEVNYRELRPPRRRPHPPPRVTPPPAPAPQGSPGPPRASRTGKNAKREDTDP